MSVSPSGELGCSQLYKLVELFGYISQSLHEILPESQKALHLYCLGRCPHCNVSDLCKVVGALLNPNGITSN